MLLDARNATVWDTDTSGCTVARDPADDIAGRAQAAGHVVIGRGGRGVVTYDLRAPRVARKRGAHRAARHGCTRLRAEYELQRRVHDAWAAAAGAAWARGAHHNITAVRPHAFFDGDEDGGEEEERGEARCSFEMQRVCYARLGEDPRPVGFVSLGAPRLRRAFRALAPAAPLEFARAMGTWYGFLHLVANATGHDTEFFYGRPCDDGDDVGSSITGGGRGSPPVADAANPAKLYVMDFGDAARQDASAALAVGSYGMQKSVQVPYFVPNVPLDPGPAHDAFKAAYVAVGAAFGKSEEAATILAEAQARFCNIVQAEAANATKLLFFGDADTKMCSSGDGKLTNEADKTDDNDGNDDDSDEVSTDGTVRRRSAKDNTPTDGGAAGSGAAPVTPPEPSSAVPPPAAPAAVPPPLTAASLLPALRRRLAAVTADAAAATPKPLFWPPARFDVRWSKTGAVSADPWNADVAYLDKPFAEVGAGDVAGAAFCASLADADTPGCQASDPHAPLYDASSHASRTALVRTREGNYFKLHLVSYDRAAQTVSFDYAQLFPGGGACGGGGDDGAAATGRVCTAPGDPQYPLHGAAGVVCTSPALPPRHRWTFDRATADVDGVWAGGGGPVAADAGAPGGAPARLLGGAALAPFPHAAAAELSKLHAYVDLGAAAGGLVPVASEAPAPRGFSVSLWLRIDVLGSAGAPVLSLRGWPPTPAPTDSPTAGPSSSPTASPSSPSAAPSTSPSAGDYSYDYDAHQDYAEDLCRLKAQRYTAHGLILIPAHCLCTSMTGRLRQFGGGP